MRTPPTSWPSRQEFRRAIALKPDYAPAHDAFGWLLAAMGREDEALAEFELAAQLDPLALFITVDGGVPYIWMRRQSDRALQQCRKALEMDPNFYWAYFMRGWIEMNAGDYDAAIADYQKARSLADTPWMIGSLGYVYARSGKVREAEDLLHDLEQLTTQRYVTPYAQALVVIGLGQKDRAFEWLNKMYEERSMFITFLKMEPGFDPLRSDPRFAALLKKVGLES
jgi:adenylate cyclase